MRPRHAVPVRARRSSCEHISRLTFRRATALNGHADKHESQGHPCTTCGGPRPNQRALNRSHPRRRGTHRQAHRDAHRASVPPGSSSLRSPPSGTPPSRRTRRDELTLMNDQPGGRAGQSDDLDASPSATTARRQPASRSLIAWSMNAWSSGLNGARCPQMVRITRSSASGMALPRIRCQQAGSSCRSRPG